MNHLYLAGSVAGMYFLIQTFHHLEPSWMHPSSNYQHQQAQQVAINAAQHHGRIQQNGPNMGASMGVGHLPDMSIDPLTDDNRRTMNFIADLLNESTREAALLELSKKREQVPELAMILWHSFGRFPSTLVLTPKPHKGVVSLIHDI
jgi:CCR4-NOT transcription complex subunit 9